MWCEAFPQMGTKNKTEPNSLYKSTLIPGTPVQFSIKSLEMFVNPQKSQISALTPNASIRTLLRNTVNVKTNENSSAVYPSRKVFYFLKAVFLYL